MDLFTIPATPPTALQSARLRFDVAQVAYRDANRAEYERGDPIPHEVDREYTDALACLRSAEAAELRRLRE